MSHADILDIGRGHIFRKHRHKNNKKVAVIYEKTVKNRQLPGYLPASCHGGAYIKSAISHVYCAYAHIFDAEAITHVHIFDAEGFACKWCGGLQLSRWPCMIGLRVGENDEKQT